VVAQTNLSEYISCRLAIAARLEVYLSAAECEKMAT
jgi:hypothetical protein